MLKVENLTYKVSDKVLLNDLSVTFMPGKMNVIVGPNGSGKSTFLKLISDQLTPSAGSIQLSERKLESFSKPELARVRAVLSQQTDLPFPLSVEEVVMMGRYPYFQYKPSVTDIRICHEALGKMHMLSYKDRNYLTLSGGEQQRVHFARVLAQLWDTPASGIHYLLLDEPITSLDLKFQHEFLKIAKETAAKGALVVAIIHDLNMALQYGDYLLALKDGCKLAEGIPTEIFTEELMKDLFSVTCKVVKFEGLPYPVIIDVR